MSLGRLSLSTLLYSIVEREASSYEQDGKQMQRCLRLSAMKNTFRLSVPTLVKAANFASTDLSGV